MSDKWTEGAVAALLANRHIEREGWAFFRGLRNATGLVRRENYFDAFAVHMWPSTGHTRVAYEIKVSRGDWLREANDPAKRAEAMKVSHFFWYAAPANVIKPDEIPEGCGWLEVYEGGSRTKKQAPHRDCGAMPEAFIYSLLRAGQADRPDAHEAVVASYQGEALTFETLCKIFERDYERAIEARAERKARDLFWVERQKTAEFKLATAVAQAMGRADRGIPPVDAFERWLGSISMGTVPTAAVEPEQIRAALSYAQNITRLCESISNVLRTQ